MCIWGNPWLADCHYVDTKSLKAEVVFLVIKFILYIYWMVCLLRYKSASIEQVCWHLPLRSGIQLLVGSRFIFENMHKLWIFEIGSAF